MFTDQRNPFFTLVGGCMYEPSPDLAQAFRHWAGRYSGENYAYFRLYNTDRDGRAYRAAIYAKMPLCIFQFRDGAVGLRFQPVVENQIPSISVWSDADGTHFDYTSEVSHVLKTKDTTHLGHWQADSVYRPDIDSLPALERMQAPTWWQLVRDFVDKELQDWDGALSVQDIGISLAMANAFHDRIYDSINGVHVETVYPDRPERYSGIFNHPSFEACRVVSLLGFSAENRSKCDRVAHRLVFDETLSAELREIGPYRVWHNGLDTVGGGSLLRGRTTYGTAYSGYPGGMATFLRKLLRYASLTDTANILPRLRQGVEWLILVMGPDGALPYSVPTFVNSGGIIETTSTGPESKAQGGAAEAIRALVEAHRIFGDKRYLDAAELAAASINPVAPYYQFRGYGDLRDASAYETDCTSGIQLANANLDLYETTDNSSYLETATALGYYVLTWHNWWRTERIDPYGFIDPMADSFCPHISPWNTALASELYSRLYAASGDSFWRKLAEFAFARAASLQNAVTGGISEVYSIKMTDAITTMGGESGMVTWGIIDAGLALLRGRGEETGRPASAPEPGGTARAIDVRIGARVSILSKPGRRLNLRSMLRPLKPGLRGIVKSALGVRAVYKMRSRSHLGLSPTSMAPKTGHMDVVSFDGPLQIRNGMRFSIERDSEATAVRLSALTHDPRIRQVCLPVIQFPPGIDRVEVTDRISRTITACRVYISDGNAILLEFLRGTSGLGIDDYRVEGNTLYCNATLKAGWQFGGDCTQIVRLSRIEG